MTFLVTDNVLKHKNKMYEQYIFLSFYSASLIKIMYIKNWLWGECRENWNGKISVLKEKIYAKLHLLLVPLS